MSKFRQAVDVLRAMQQNPDDMTRLPEIINQLSEMERDEEAYQARIASLIESNKAYLAQIPTTYTEPNKPEEPPAPPTLADAREAIINIMNGGIN